MVRRYDECLATIHVIQGVHSDEFSTDSIGLIRLSDASRSAKANSYLLQARFTCSKGREGPGSVTCKKMQVDKEDMSFKLG